MPLFGYLLNHTLDQGWPMSSPRGKCSGPWSPEQFQ